MVLSNFWFYLLQNSKFANMLLIYRMGFCHIKNYNLHYSLELPQYGNSSITKPVLIEVSLPKPVGKRKQRKTFIWKVDTLQPDINLCSIFHFNFEHLSQNHQCTYTLIYRNPDVQIFQQILAISVRLQYLIRRILYLPKLFRQTGLSKL